MNHQGAPRRTKEHKVPDFLVLSLFRAPSCSFVVNFLKMLFKLIKVLETVKGKQL
jgi:hypothetical protein